MIALVITIIILLILAGVTINLVIGQNGIVNRAITAKQKNDISVIEEEIKLSYIAVNIDDQGNLNGLTKEQIEVKMQNELRKKDTLATAICNTEKTQITGVYKGYRYIIDVEKAEVTLNQLEHWIEWEVPASMVLGKEGNIKILLRREIQQESLIIGETVKIKNENSNATITNIQKEENGYRLSINTGNTAGKFMIELTEGIKTIEGENIIPTSSQLIEIKNTNLINYTESAEYQNFIYGTWQESCDGNLETMANFGGYEGEIKYHFTNKVKMSQINIVTASSNDGTVEFTVYGKNGNGEFQQIGYVKQNIPSLSTTKHYTVSVPVTTGEYYGIQIIGKMSASYLAFQNVYFEE